MLCADLDLLPAHLILASRASLDLGRKGLAPLLASHNLGVGSGVLKQLLGFVGGFGMDALTTVCSWNTNGIMILAWML